MATPDQYPFLHHPCYSESRQKLWARIHLPVAPSCNVKCIFCDHNAGSACHTSKPGYAASLMEPEGAISRTMDELERDPLLKIVAISGPGEPLANDETFTTLEGIRHKNKDLNFCLSTNGVLLKEKVLKLKDLGVKSISVSMSAIYPNTAARIYEWAMIDGEMRHGLKMGKEIIQKQLEGIEKTASLGITIKVNTILIPQFNTRDMNELSNRIAISGAAMQNIVPLIRIRKNPNLIPPTRDELAQARQICMKNIPQFTHCKQCRSDVVGIPGADRIL